MSARRERTPRGASLTGDRYIVDVGPVAHGGHFVARHDGRVIFIRHALPGERVVVEVTEGEKGSRYLRGDAVSVESAAPSRVEAPCPFAGPGRCGGCDFQHVSLEEQRLLKAAVVREQFHRLAGSAANDLVGSLVVEPAPDERDGLRWRTRVRYAVSSSGARGFRKHRSHDVVPVDDCLITHPAAVSLVESSWSGEPAASHENTEQVRDHRFRVASDGFWQPHRDAPALLVDAVLDALDPQPGESCMDLYAGVGLFARFLADRVGEAGDVFAVEADRNAVRLARSNLAGVSGATVIRGRVDAVLKDPRTPSDVDLVVLDPPRTGARATVVRAIAGLAPGRVVYVACDPAALARDVATFGGLGYALVDLRAYALFPMTHHVECVALLEPR